MKAFVRKYGFVVFVFWTTVALSFSGAYVAESTYLITLRCEVDGTGISQIIIFAALCAFYYYGWKKVHRIRHWSIHFLSFLFSLFTVMGMSFTENGNLDFVLAGHRQFLVACLVIMGYVFLFEVAIRFVYFFFDERNTWKTGFHDSLSDVSAKNAGMEGNGHLHRVLATLRHLAETHTILFSFCCIYLCWLPGLIAFLPGSLPYDGYYQLMQGLGYCALTDQHSWLMTLGMGLVMRVGRHVSDNFGLALITLTLSVLEAGCYAIACRIIFRWKLPFSLKVFPVLFFGLWPFFWNYAQANLKDGPFMAALVLYMAIYIDTCLLVRNTESSESTKKNLWIHILSLLGVGFMVCVLRNNGPYIIIPADLLLIFLSRKGTRRYMGMLLVCAFGAVWIYGNVLAPMAGVHSFSTTTRASMYLSFQVVGRYMNECPEDLSEEEAEVLDTVFKDYKSLGDLYVPYNCDPVKKTFNFAAGSDNIRAYRKVALSMIRKHPRVCMEAVLYQLSGYFYIPFGIEKGNSGGFYAYIQDGIGSLSVNVYYIFPESVRNHVVEVATFWRRLPVVSWLTSPATPTWLLFLLAGYLTWHKKWLQILPMAIPALNIFILMFFSPVSGLLRYAMPSIACLPIILYWVLMSTEPTEEELQMIKMTEA